MTKTIHCHWENRFVLQLVWGPAEILPYCGMLFKHNRGPLNLHLCLTSNPTLSTTAQTEVKKRYKP